MSNRHCRALKNTTTPSRYQSVFESVCWTTFFSRWRPRFLDLHSFSSYETSPDTSLKWIAILPLQKMLIGPAVRETCTTHPKILHETEVLNLMEDDLFVEFTRSFYLIWLDATYIPAPPQQHIEIAGKSSLLEYKWFRPNITSSLKYLPAPTGLEDQPKVTYSFILLHTLTYQGSLVLSATISSWRDILNWVTAVTGLFFDANSLSGKVSRRTSESAEAIARFRSL